MDSSSDPLAGFVLFAVMLAADFILACYGAALQDVSDPFLETENKKGNHKAGEVLKLKDHVSNFISACRFMPIITAFPALWSVLLLDGWKRWACAAAMAALLYLFGKSVPALIGRKFSEGCSLKLFGAARFLMYITMPFTLVLGAVTYVIVLIFGINPREMEDEVTEDEIISMVNEGHEQGVLDEHEAEMIQNIFKLDDKQAHDIMTHRKDVIAIDGSKTLEETIAFLAQQTNSRFPVYDGDIDNVVGILHFRDAMVCENRGDCQDKRLTDIADLLRPARFIPETRDISVLFRSMQAQKQQMVIVVDEYGEMAGIVTMEDILEEIVGNILDEYDVEEHQIIAEGDGVWIMDGMTPIEQVDETLDTALSEGDYDTLNGYLVSKLDRIPEVHETTVIEDEGYSFQIMEVKSNTIRWVRVTRQVRRDGEEPSEKEKEHSEE